MSSRSSGVRRGPVERRRSCILHGAPIGLARERPDVKGRSIPYPCETTNMITADEILTGGLVLVVAGGMGVIFTRAWRGPAGDPREAKWRERGAGDRNGVAKAPRGRFKSRNGE